VSAVRTQQQLQCNNNAPPTYIITALGTVCSQDQVDRLEHRERQKCNPLGKIWYLWNCIRYIHQIYKVYRWGYSPHILQILLIFLFSLAQ